MRTYLVSYRCDPLLRAIEAFLGESGLSATSFGMRAMNDPRFVHEMRAGREVRRATRARVAAYIRAARTGESGAPEGRATEGRAGPPNRVIGGRS
ncbi:conserved hypothetical protein [Gluconacetobacter diazotrophicus PA1 5]|nr:hypothetical protein [Gluconacetobacter diazotrophicus]ACI52287.1 conserved hypothetical protein [Gluconacetobacter diazotrophicus PA1 5]TWB04817.1 hypothetical protein FBZ86_11939 [Gluconacetobacter diazotrophicus]